MERSEAAAEITMFTYRRFSHYVGPKEWVERGVLVRLSPRHPGPLVLEVNPFGQLPPTV